VRAIALSLLVILALGLVARADGPASTQAKEENVVKKGTIHPRIDAEGYFEPVDPLEVRLRPEAYVGDLKIVEVVAHGASVKNGDVLLRIDEDNIKNQIDAAKSDLENSKAGLTKAKSDVELGEQGDAIALKMAQKELANAKAGLQWFDDVDGKQMITTAELQTRTAKGAVDDQQDELDQLKKMYKSEELTNATADIVVKRALRNLELTKITESMAEEHETKTKKFDFERERTKLLFAIDQQTNSLSQLEASQAQSKVTRKTALDTATEGLDRAQKKLDDLNKDLASFTVKAPADGVVYYGQLANGGWQNSGPTAVRLDDRVSSGQVVMTFFVPGKLRVAAQIPESQLHWISAGAKARIVPASSAQTNTDGVCGAIIPTSAGGDHGTSFSMPVQPEKVDPKLAPGEKVSVQIDLPEVKDVLIAPVAAVQHGRAHVKSDHDVETWKDVTTGMWDDKNVEIKSGLKEGEELAGEK
jgi:multidrug efflux pump subunit AcrA (membrane-fusion protein)